MPSDYVKDLVDHKQRVAEHMQFVANDLFRRATIHDNSKFSPEEFEAYEEAFPELQRYAYGTPEFRAAIAKIKPAVQHHYKHNRHHPEYHEHGINDMTLMDIIEMACDWLAASARSKTHIETALQINKERFEIDDQLFKIIVETMKWIDPQRFLVTDPLV